MGWKLQVASLTNCFILPNKPVKNERVEEKIETSTCQY